MPNPSCAAVDEKLIAPEASQLDQLQLRRQFLIRPRPGDKPRAQQRPQEKGTPKQQHSNTGDECRNTNDAPPACYSFV